MSNESLSLIVVAGILLVCFAIFSLRQLSTGRYQHPRVQKDGGSIFFGGTYFMNFVYWLFTPAVRLFTALKISPNVISLTCLFISLCAGISFAYGEFVLAGWIWFLGSMMDALDGLVARSLDQATPAGSVIDSTVDRVAELSVFFGLAFYYRNHPLILVITFLALAGSVLTSYISAKGEILKVQLPRGVMRRAERAVYIGGAALLAPIVAPFLEGENVYPQYHLMAFVLLLVALFSITSSVYRVVFLCRELENRQRKD